MLRFLCKNLSGCPVALKEMAFFSLVRSNLEYASAVWDPFLQGDINNLQKIQRRAARFVQGRGRWGPIRDAPFDIWGGGGGARKKLK